VHGSQVLGQTAAVWERSSAAAADEWLGARVASLVSTKSLLRLERLSTCRTDVVCGRRVRLMDHLVCVQCRRGLETLAARAAWKRSLGGVDGRVDFEVAAIHERSTTDFTDVACGVGRVSATVSSQ